jgi:Bax protein
MKNRTFATFIVALIALVLVLASAIYAIRHVSQARIRTIEIEKVDDLETFYSEIDYTLDGVRNDGAPVPRIDLTAFPDNWLDLDGSPRRSRLFLESILPLALLSNDALADDRQRLTTMQGELASGTTLSSRDRSWLGDMVVQYRIDPTTLDDDPVTTVNTLMPRVDGIPASLVLAQAAIESGWGSSRFTHEGNALFGQWTFNGEGMVPEGGQRHDTNRVAAFPELLSSVESYMLNLNSHKAYEGFRTMRAQQRAAGDTLDGYALATQLTAYSENGGAYVTSLQALMSQHDLTALRDAALDPDSLVYTLNP